MATRVAQLRNPDAPNYNAAMRDVVRNCIHGVDRNPMAIELAKVALWIESVEPGKPLGFLDESQVLLNEIHRCFSWGFPVRPALF